MSIVRGNGARKVSARRAGRGGRRARISAEILERRQLLATIVVNSAGDADGADGGLTLSLRQAIEVSNGTLAITSLAASQAALVVGALGTPNTIDFAIPGSGPFVIEPATALPTITKPVVIDGYSQPGAHPNTNASGQGENTVIEIEIDGVNAPGANGLDLQASNSIVQGLAIGGFTAGSTTSGYGILIEGQTADLIQGDFLGTDATGAQALPNTVGIEDINSLGGATSSLVGLNTIGGTAVGAGNVISGNSGDGLDLQRLAALGFSVDFATDLVEGNLIGTDVTGTRALPDGGDGIKVAATEFLGVGAGSTTGASGSTIGGTAAGAGNVISGNAEAGIAITGVSFVNPDGALVEGNRIGTDVTGTKALPDGGGGIELDGGNSSTVGGTAAGAGNIISGNEGDGIAVTEAYAPALLVEGNLIGTDATGLLPLPNTGNGLSYIAGYSTVGGTAAGAANIIAFNQGAGVDLVPPPIFSHPYVPPRVVLISGNSIFANGGMGIIGATSAPIPRLQTVEIVPAGSVINGLLDATASTTYTLEFFSNTSPDPSGSGQGQFDLGSTTVTTDASGHASFSFFVGLPFLSGEYVSATATDPSVGTSDFARNLLAYTSGTTTTLVGPAAPVLAGQAVAFHAIVATGTGVATGEVDFLEGGVVIGSATLDASGMATLVTSQLPPGSLAITAAYSGDVSHAPGVSSPLAVSVLAPVTVTLAGPDQAAIQGQPTTFSATVASTVGGVPTGEVDFLEGGVVIGSAALDAQGLATFVTSQLLAGPHAITATYPGDSSHASGQSNAIALSVAEPATSVVLLGPSQAVTQGQPVAFSATVTSTVVGVATGEVAFSADGVVIGTAPLDASGVAVFLAGGLGVGPHAIQATYLGDATNAPSVSNAVAVTVAAPTTVVSLLGPNRVATQGQPITFNAAVASTGLGVPTGSVAFLEDGVVLGTSPIGTDGLASFVTDQLMPGPHVITAVYLGDSTHPSALSNAVAVGVFNATAFGGPAVTSDVLSGPSTVTVTFNRGLLIGPAQDVANYRIIGPRNHSIAIASAVYDPSNASVTLTTARALDPRQAYRLTINGQTGDRVVDVFGIALNGKAKGKPGHDYSGKVAVKKPAVVKVAHPKAPKVKPTARASTRKKGR